MTYTEPTSEIHHTDTAPGDQRLVSAGIAEGVKSYLVGLGLATLLTVVSFFVSRTTLVWPPSIPVALIVLAIAQMGVHLVFFLHITTGPDNVNNVMALAFGVLIVLLLLTGSLWIMANLNHNMTLRGHMMQTQFERALALPTVTANGVVGPKAITPVRARVSGIIQTIDCDANAHVKAGEVCAKIDPRPYQEVVDQNKAELAAAEVRLGKDQTDLAKAESIFESHGAAARRRTMSHKAIERSRQAVERMRTRTERDEARVAEIQEALHAAEANLGYTDIVSPIDGTVVSLNVEKGETIAGDSETPLFVVVGDLAVAHIDAMVSAKDIGKIKLGAKASITIGTFPNRLFSGVVTQIRPSREENGRAATYDVVISTSNPDLLLAPGMAATIRMGNE